MKEAYATSGRTTRPPDNTPSRNSTSSAFETLHKTIIYETKKTLNENVAKCLFWLENGRKMNEIVRRMKLHDEGVVNLGKDHAFGDDVVDLQKFKKNI